MRKIQPEKSGSGQVRCTFGRLWDSEILPLPIVRFRPIADIGRPCEPARMGRFILLLLPIVLASCDAPEARDFRDDGTVLADRAGLPASPVRYFPPLSEQPHINCDYGGGPKSQPVVDEFENRWFSRHLAAAEEPSLYLGAKRTAPERPFTLRFTWLRSFHAPVVIRIEESGDEKYRLTAKELAGAGGYESGTIKRKVERQLRADEARKLRQILSTTRLIHLRPKTCAMGCDGAEWVFELVDGQGYHVLTRWSPEYGPVREAGQYLMGLSGWTFAEVY